MLKKTVTAICLLILTAVPVLLDIAPVNACIPPLWVKRYNGAGNFTDDARAIVMDGSGNVYVTGTVDQGANNDYATIKYNSAGVQQWVELYNGPANGDDTANAIAVDGAGNVYVTGNCGGSPTTATNIVTIKYSTAGVQQWAKSYTAGAGASYDGANVIALDGAGNVYVGGYGDWTDEDCLVLKYNNAGALQWARKYDGPGAGGDERINGIAVTTAGNVYVTGYTWGVASARDYTTIKYSTSGVRMWVQRYAGAGGGNDEAKAIDLDGAGNVYVTGHCDWDAPSGNDYVTIKYSSAGAQLWMRRYAGPGNGSDYAYDIGVDGLNNVIITGQSMGTTTDYDITTVKYNSSGTVQWIRRWDYASSHLADIAYSLAIDSGNNIYVTGTSTVALPSNFDYRLIKYNSAGTIQWMGNYNGPGNLGDVARDVCVNNAGNAYITGYSEGAGSRADYATIKY